MEPCQVVGKSYSVLLGTQVVLLGYQGVQTGTWEGPYVVVGESYRGLGESYQGLQNPIGEPCPELGKPYQGVWESYQTLEIWRALSRTREVLSGSLKQESGNSIETRGALSRTRRALVGTWEPYRTLGSPYGGIGEPYWGLVDQDSWI